MWWRCDTASGSGPNAPPRRGCIASRARRSGPAARRTSGIGKIRNLFAGNRDDNPLGARALYFGNEYRLHGTSTPANIGGVLPLGCIAVLNDVIIDFYDRAPIETRVVVMD